MKLDDWGRYDSARSLAHRRGSSCRTRNDVAIERGSYQDSRMAGWIPMRCGFKNPKSADGPYRSQCWTTPSAAGASTNGAPGPFLRWAQRATSVLAWIACAATRSPCGQAEALPSPTPGEDSSASDGETRVVIRPRRGPRRERRCSRPLVHVWSCKMKATLASSTTAGPPDEGTSYLAAFRTQQALHHAYNRSEIAVSTIIKPAGFPGDRGTSLRCARRNTCPSSLAVPARSI